MTNDDYSHLNEWTAIENFFRPASKRVLDQTVAKILNMEIRCTI